MMRVPGQPPILAMARPKSSRSTTLAMARLAFQPLQIWRVRVGSLLPSCQFTSSGHTPRSEEHTSELQSLMRISYAVFCLKKTKYIYMQESQETKYSNKAS